ncbi:MAG: DUF2341 domain-containing protein, partial [Candidatus Thorarchaeota archaeon]
MKSRYYISKINLKKTKVLIFLLFTLIIPMIINSQLFSVVHEAKKEMITDDAVLPPKLNAPFNAQHFAYFKTITIDHTQVSGTSGLANFPFLISILDEDLRGDVQSDGDDIAFSLNNVWLDHEIELFNQAYSPTHAKLVVWVRIPALSVNVDTVIRMYYGNSTMSSRENPEGVWDSNYYAVYHMNQDPSGSSILDSTANNYDLTPGTGLTSGDLVDGIIGKAIDFGGVNDEYLEITSGFSPPRNSLSLEMWFRPHVRDLRQYYFRGRSSPNRNPRIRYNSGNYITTIIENNLGNQSYASNSAVTSYTDQYYHFIITWQGLSVGRQKQYLNGTLIDDDYDPEAEGTADWWGGFNIGSDVDHSDPVNGAIEEFRITSNARPIDWIETEFNNQYNPNAFYTVGAEQDVVWEPSNTEYFTYYKLITIDHNEISGTDRHTNFPYLLSFVDSDLKYHTQPDGDDIAFAFGGDWLDHEILLYNQTYSATEAQLKVWVEIPQLYATKNTTIAMYYGNSTMSSRENSQGVWDSGYEAVYHLDDDFLDSTSHNRDGINTGSVDISGIIGDGQDF